VPIFNVVSEVKEKLGANPVPITIPIGAEETFEGVVDLIEMKAIRWKDDATLVNYLLYGRNSSNMVEISNEYRAKLVEAVAEHDDALMERFFEDPESITVEEMLTLSAKLPLAWHNHSNDVRFFIQK
jgi:elongation factor G